MQVPTDTYTDELADLEKLSAELTTRGLHATLHGRLPYRRYATPGPPC